MWDGISPLIFRNVSAEWSNIASAVDASEWGLGVCEAVVSQAKVQQAGRFSERRRFAHPEFAKPRQAAAAAAAAADEAPFPVTLGDLARQALFSSGPRRR